MKKKNTASVSRFKYDKYEFLFTNSFRSVPDIVFSYSLGKHANDCYEFNIILQGECEFQIEETVYHLTIGDFIIVPPDTNHHLLIGSKELIKPCFPFKMSATPESAEFLQMVTKHPKSRATDLIFSLSRSIMTDLDLNLPDGPKILNCKEFILLVEVTRLLTEQKQLNESKINNSHIERTDIINSFFEEYTQTNAPATILADKLHISIRQLNRILKTEYGMNFSEKAAYTRLSRAQWLLRNTDMPVESIYSAVGYSSRAAFFKAFKHSFDITPLKYRNGFFSVKK